MTYDGVHLRIAWLGFTDVHSDVAAYYLTVGTLFGSSDLLVSELMNRLIRVSPRYYYPDQYFTSTYS